MKIFAQNEDKPEFSQAMESIAWFLPENKLMSMQSISVSSPLVLQLIFETQFNYSYSDVSSGSREGPWGPGPPIAPMISSKSCSFQAKPPIFSKCWAQGSLPWGQNSTGPP